MRRFGEPRLVVVARWIWLCELVPLPRQELPAAILLRPDRQNADLRAGRLAVDPAFRDPEMARDGVIAGDADLQTRELERLVGSLARHHAVDELGLVLYLSAGMAVAQLRGRELLQLCLVLRQRCLAQPFSGVTDPGLVAALGRGGGVGEQARRPERQGAGSGQITTADWHDFHPRSRFCVDAAQSNRESGRAATGATQLLGGFAAFWRRTISAFNCRIMRANSGLL